MLLYLHIGTEKTGSSFIQSIIYYNRQVLQDGHIFAPKDNFEDIQIPKGQVSGGNGFKFYKLLKDMKFREASNYLNAQKKRAESLHCRSILLSNENLFRVFSENSVEVMSILKDLNFKIKLCLFLRDPLDHITSMYKHRNKHGKHSNFKDWLYQDYSTIKNLKTLIEKLESHKEIYEIQTFLYEKSKSIKNIFFEDFLGLNAKNLFVKHKKVNKSLTFSEILLLTNLFDKTSNLRYKLSLNLQNLDQKLKANDPTSLEDYHKFIILKYIKNNSLEIRNTYQRFNINLKLKQNIQFNKINKVLIEPKHLYGSYSQTQLEALAESISSEIGLNKLYFKINSQLKYLIFLLKSKINN